MSRTGAPTRAAPPAPGGRPARWRARAGAAGYRLALLLLRASWVLARAKSSGLRCVTRPGDEILLVRHSYGDRRWMLPGGRVRRGEDAAATARREMAQELGVACPGGTSPGPPRGGAP